MIVTLCSPKIISEFCSKYGASRILGISQRKDLIKKYKDVRDAKAPVNIFFTCPSLKADNQPDDNNGRFGVWAKFTRACDDGKIVRIFVKDWSEGHLALLSRSALFFGWKGIVFILGKKEKESNNLESSKYLELELESSKSTSKSSKSTSQSSKSTSQSSKSTSQSSKSTSQSSKSKSQIIPYSADFIRKSMGASLYIPTLVTRDETCCQNKSFLDMDTGKLETWLHGHILLDKTANSSN